jgi:hypothetical protein
MDITDIPAQSVQVTNMDVSGYGDVAGCWTRQAIDATRTPSGQRIDPGTTEARQT